MVDADAIFLFATAAGSSTRLPTLIRELVALGRPLYTVLTPNVANVTPIGPLVDLPGNRWIATYGQRPLDRYPFGSLLVAPCTFNTFNKLALGLADNLATSMIADGIGAGLPVVIAPSMNHGLWAHPQVRLSHARLGEWGCTIVEPEINESTVTMAPTERILAAL